MSPHDPVNWMSFEMAEAMAIAACLTFGRNYRVGFVHAVESKLFTLDVDSAAMPDGQWHPLVRKLHALLPRAAFETSVSGTGGHFWGRYEGAEPEHACVANVDGLKIEFYTSGLPIALGDQTTAIGDAGADCTMELHQLIASYFPAAVASGVTEWTHQPCEGWRGPDNDEELIALAMRLQSPSAAFGKTVSFADLWNGNEQALAAKFPSSNGDAYDRVSPTFL